MKFTVLFYRAPNGDKPVADFLAELKTKHPDLYNLVRVGIKKIEDSRYHREPLTEQVDPEHSVLELRVGKKNIARVFWFFQPGQKIIMTNGYVKKQMKLDQNELQRARNLKKDWEERTE